MRWALWTRRSRKWLQPPSTGLCGIRSVSCNGYWAKDPGERDPARGAGSGAGKKTAVARAPAGGGQREDDRRCAWGGALEPHRPNDGSCTVSPARAPAPARGVGGVVVDDEVHIEIARHVGLDLVEELAELPRPVSREALADHSAGGDVEGGEERGGCRGGYSSWLRRAAWPGRIGSIGWLRSSAWICDFSSTHRTTAWAGSYRRILVMVQGFRRRRFGIARTPGWRRLRSRQ